MPVSYVPSSQQLEVRQKSTARKRRRNHNVEIGELGDLLPIPASQNVDKISVLRITSSYIRFREFVKTAYQTESTANGNNFSEMLSMALDGFLLVTDKDANILYVSETITDYIGLSQLDVIGQTLYDITHSDDQEALEEAMKPKGNLPDQSRQFYVRFKSSVSPGRIHLSRFSAHIMVQVSGRLKLRPTSLGEERRLAVTGDDVIGLVAECRLIESSSIVEVSIPQRSFTSTMSMDCTILSVDTKVEDLIGFTVDDFVGTKMSDYFHPAEHALHIPCYFVLMQTGYGISPMFRFMTSEGDWVWMQLEGLVRYKAGTNTPQFVETKCKVVSACNGKLRFIEQKEFYAAKTCKDPDADKDPHRDAYMLDQYPDKPIPAAPTPIVKALQETNLPSMAIDTILQGRELGLQDLRGSVKRLHPPKSLVKEVQSIFGGLPPGYPILPLPPDYVAKYSSDAVAAAKASPPQPSAPSQPSHHTESPLPQSPPSQLLPHAESTHPSTSLPITSSSSLPPPTFAQVDTLPSVLPPTSGTTATLPHQPAGSPHVNFDILQSGSTVSFQTNGMVAAENYPSHSMTFPLAPICPPPLQDCPATLDLLIDGPTTTTATTSPSAPPTGNFSYQSSSIDSPPSVLSRDSLSSPPSDQGPPSVQLNVLSPDSGISCNSMPPSVASSASLSFQCESVSSLLGNDYQPSANPDYSAADELLTLGLENGLLTDGSGEEGGLLSCIDPSVSSHQTLLLDNEDSEGLDQLLSELDTLGDIPATTASGKGYQVASTVEVVPLSSSSSLSPELSNGLADLQQPLHWQGDDFQDVLRQLL